MHYINIVIHLLHYTFISVQSFVELVTAIFEIPGVSAWLSVKINQDPLEKHFGLLRQRGSTNENPTVYEALKSTQALRVVNGISVDDITGNCRGQRKRYLQQDTNTPLPKRKRH